MNTQTANQKSNFVTKNATVANQKRPFYWYGNAKIQNHEDGAIILLPLAGYQKSDVSISIKNQVLTIESTASTKNETPKYLRREFGKKPFKRTFNLDKSIDSENIKATMEHGVLRVELSKKAAYTEVTQIEIQ